MSKNVNGELLVEAYGITKDFPGVRALEEVDLSVRAGTVHCVMGENGAGKSTLVRILTGVYRPDAGEIRLDGRDPKQDHSATESVSFVPQELDLFEEMTVAENLFMPFGRAGFKGAAFSKRKMIAAAYEYLERFDIGARPEQYVKELSVSDKQLLQIARAYTSKTFKTLILDEPTTSLTDTETERLFEILKGLRDEGRAIIFISHKLQEMFALGDQVTVLRNGKRVGVEDVGNVTQDWVIRSMSGEDVDVERMYRPQTEPGKTLLKVDGLSGFGFEDVSFELHEGEILGFAGLVGAGRTEIMQTVYGFLPSSAGDVEFLDAPLGGKTYESMEHGLVYLPEERKQHGILETLSVRHNIGIGLLQKTTKAGVVSARKERKLVREVIDRYDVRTPSMEQRIAYLSGGNQQKAIIGRAMFGSPRVIIFDEPTKGIDVKTKFEIYEVMKQLAEEQRVGIVLISSELEELLRCANRVLTIYEGHVTGEFNTSETPRSTIMSAMINAEEEESGNE
jgi:ribose transport system ATP-binding protein